MAVQRDRITVFPPDGETVTVDILDTGVSLGTVHAERATTRTLTLPLTITAATSFYVPAGTGPYDVSVKLDGEEIAGPSGSPVTVSTFPAEVRARVNAAELPSLSGGSSAVLISGSALGGNQNVQFTAPHNGAPEWTFSAFSEVHVPAGSGGVLLNAPTLWALTALPDLTSEQIASYGAVQPQLVGSVTLTLDLADGSGGVSVFTPYSADAVQVVASPGVGTALAWDSTANDHGTHHVTLTGGDLSVANPGGADVVCLAKIDFKIQPYYG